MSLLDKASLVITPNATKASKLYSVIPSDGSGDMTVVRATTATRVNEDGLIESVALNVPRIDYTDSTCPSVLVEPQRTNISQFQEVGAGGFNIATINTGVGILGLTSFQVISNTAVFGDDPFILSNNQYQANTSYTFSFYTDFSKCNNTSIGFIFLGFFPSVASLKITINKITKDITSFDVGGIWTLNDSKAIQISGEIYKIVGTATPNTTSLSNSRNYISTFNDGSFLEIAGIQLEAGSYDTSFIKKPTSASVTRNADVISKTGISDLIGQTEGTIFLDFIAEQTTTLSQSHIWIGNGANEIGIYGGNQLIFYSSGGVSINGGNYTTGQRYKIAFAYKLNDYVVYVNGVQKGMDTSATVPATSNLSINSYFDGSELQKKQINSAQLYKTRLTNEELATLTTL